MGIKADEVEPAQVVGQVLGGNAAERPQEAFDLLVAAVDGLDMEVAAHPLASRLNEGFVADAKGNGGRRETAGPIGDEQDVRADGGFQHRLDGNGRDCREHGAHRGAGAVGGDQDRHLLARQPALGGLAAAFTRRPIELPVTLAAVQQIGFIGLDDAAQRGGSGVDRLEEAMAPAERRGQRDLTLRGRVPDRVADAERPGEIKPALLEPQPGQRRAGQGVEDPMTVVSGGRFGKMRLPLSLLWRDR